MQVARDFAEKGKPGSGPGVFPAGIISGQIPFQFIVITGNKYGYSSTNGPRSLRQLATVAS
jgi:hypothetical protein